ncbi:hypothetical protein [Actinomadura monticuli]|uniref:Uncharacterized protein n=1 Tax=Actinomadura monticuli TaxID=3097367 RepID=A0ABV4Q6Y4_9ACTN
MASSTVAAGAAQSYTYTRPSGLDAGLLGLSTSGGTTSGGPRPHPHFFSGVLTQAAPAEAAGVRGAIPEVEAVAARGGSSRLVQESARLHRTLAT